MTDTTILDAPSLAYTYHDSLYINSTFRCPSACRFCIKFAWEYKYRGHNLKLSADPPIEKILEAAPNNLSDFKEVVYCGYGESTYRLNELPVLSKSFRERGAKKIRLNTVGLGNLIHGRDIVPELVSVVDAISISMNTMNPEMYINVIRPLNEFRDKAHNSVKEFCRSSVKHIPDTTLTSLDYPGFHPAEVEAFALSIGAQFRLRPYLDNYEER